MSILHDTWAVSKVFIARLRFLAVFLAAALVVGYWDNIKNHVDKWTRPAVASDMIHAPVSDIEYYCPMHPNVVRAEPGNCPSCSMPLVKRKKSEQTKLPDDVMARVQLSPQRVALANIHTTPVGYKKLVRQIRAVGVLDYDETRVAQLSVRFAGRADQLFLQYAGQAVKAGEPVYSLYSPEVYTAQREYMQARKRVNDLHADASPEARADVAAVYNASLQKLVLWGLTRAQIKHLDKEFDRTGKIPSHLPVLSPISGIVVRKDIFEGSYVQVGDTPYTIADLGTLWLQAKIYERDVPLVHIGQSVDVIVDALPNENFPGTITFLAYQVDAQTRTLDARIEVQNPGLRLRPGMFANALLQVPLTGASAPVITAEESHPSNQSAQAYSSALQQYLEAHQQLTQSKAENVSTLLHGMLARLEPIARDPAIAPAHQRLTTAVHATMEQAITDLRNTFKDISSSMIEIGKITGLPPDAPAVQVFHCPMVKADWLQKPGTTANPYDPRMPTCGQAVESLPRSRPQPATRPAAPDGQVLAVPRSAVIDTGHNKIVYVEFAPGVFDMHAVKLGPAAADDYPVVSGLNPGDRVVTIGAFLVDAENRLNPTTIPDH